MLMALCAKKSGFSLMEVNMAILVVAIGVLGMIALFPLGLRESVQAKEDTQQAMYADFVLSQLVPALSQTNLTWSEWVGMDGGVFNAKLSKIDKCRGSLPSTLTQGFTGSGSLDLLSDWTVGGSAMKPEHARITLSLFVSSDGDYGSSLSSRSRRIMGVGVQSTDRDLPNSDMITNNVVYYTEVIFRGDPNS